MRIEIEPSLREDLIALLEDGPKDTGVLVQWLNQPQARVNATLARMARDGVVTRVGARKQWALVPHTQEHPPAATPTATTAAAVAAPKGGAVPAAPPVSPERRPLAAPPLEDDIPDEGDDLDADAALAADDWDEPADKPLMRKPVGRPKAGLRVAPQAAASTRGPAWWVGKSREEFSAEARQQFEQRLQFQKLPASLFPNQKTLL